MFQLEWSFPQHVPCLAGSGNRAVISPTLTLMSGGVLPAPAASAAVILRGWWMRMKVLARRTGPCAVRWAKAGPAVAIRIRAVARKCLVE